MSGREYKVEYPREMQFCVPDRMWVAEAHDGPVSYYDSDPLLCRRPVKPFETRDNQLEVIGLETERIMIRRSFGSGPPYDDSPAFDSESRTWLYISRRPFGIISTPTLNGEPHGIRRYFTPAQQIHKGELGRKMPINMPDVVQTLDDPEVDEGYPVSQKTIGWVRLDHLANQLGTWEKPLLERYFAFTDYIYPQLPMVIATAPEDFAGRIVRYPQRHNFGLERAIKEVLRHPTGYIWVRASWAAIVLRLRALGYKPKPLVQAA